MKTRKNNLRHYRELKGLTQQQVADYLGFKSTDRISRWEAGLTYPHVRNLFKLGVLFELHAEELYSEKEF
ncbi:MAG: hypothetical protein BGO70_01045 [Bacteroidetes bacterium 43-93]|uniref:helix-turn-helix transcriptional regulator n=1 Tax=uncultured Dysgonomonas sp. TaxID=206096 RepID=UPI00092BFBBC|nr:helix-turn-helix transcriptional regulator [uncultured Dysgonomonas sp.]MBN9483135.1 helix-turn-helix transcriptional regulator [Bacteroidota bacterium]OJW96298.1 MAG: hypothetical protein BGO70_01045 [Bacteroidetes bacterium 43-93]